MVVAVVWLVVSFCWAVVRVGNGFGLKCKVMVSTWAGIVVGFDAGIESQHYN